MQAVEILVVISMIFANAVFAAYEIAMASVPTARLRGLVHDQRAGASAALLMKEGIAKSLAVVQLGITLVGLVAGATGGLTATGAVAPFLRNLGFGDVAATVMAVLVVVLPLTGITIVVGELLPKLFALRNQEFVCLALSPVMKWFAFGTWPLIWLLETSASRLMDLSERLWRPKPHAEAEFEAAELQELRAIASLARTSRLIGAREEGIILGAARLASRTLAEIVLPAQYIRMLIIDTPLEDCLASAHRDMHTRFPVAERRGDPQTIVGYVTFKDLAAALKSAPGAALRGILRPILSLSDDLPISAALEHLLREHTHIALVRDHDGRVAGMITLEDVLEELLGDIQDEYDLLPVHVVRAGGGWIAGGGATLSRLRELTGAEFRTDGPAHNLSGWMIERLGHAPQGGESVRQGPLRAQVRKVRREHVLEAAIEIAAGPP